MVSSSDSVSDFWDKAFKSIDISDASLNSMHVQNVMDTLSENGARDVLDLGCGYGRWSVALAMHGFRVTSVDISPSAIGLVKKLALRYGCTVRTHVLAAQDLSDIQEKFDAVVCNSVLDHMKLSDSMLAIQNIVSVLVDDGIAFLSFDGAEENEPDEKCIKILDDGTWRYSRGEREGMLWRFFTDSEIRELCRHMTVFKFIVELNGKRCVWCRQKKPGRGLQY